MTEKLCQNSVLHFIVTSAWRGILLYTFYAQWHFFPYRIIQSFNFCTCRNFIDLGLSRRVSLREIKTVSFFLVIFATNFDVVF